MQRLKVCRKLMAFVLTLCMVLPLISNQYLVVRAEESETKGIFSLAGSCQTIDMTQASSKELTGQTYTENQYQYMISPMGNQYGTDNGALYKITLAAGQMIKVEKDGTATWGYWYIDSGTDLYYYNQGNIYKNQENDTVNVYCWIAKSGDSDTSFSLAVKSGQKITDVSGKASDIGKNLTLSKTEGNYVENIISGSTMLSGWLYKTTGEETYRITDLKKEDYISVALFDEVGSQTITLMAEDYVGNETTGDELSSQFHVTDQIKYILIWDNNALDGRTLTVGQAKKLSEIADVKELKKSEKLTYSKNDKEVTFARGKCYLYKLRVPANSMVGLTVTVKNDNYTWSYTADDFYIYDEDGLQVGDKTDSGAVINNSSDEAKIYYIGVNKSVITDGYIFELRFNDLKQLKDCTQVELSLDNPTVSISDTDQRIETVARLSYNDNYKIDQGVLLKVIVPKKSTICLNTHYLEYYTDLSKKSKFYSEDYVFERTNDTENDEIIYILAEAGSTWTITLKQDSGNPVIPKLSELKENAISLNEGINDVDQSQKKDAMVNYDGVDESGNPIGWVWQTGILYKYEIPAHTNVTFELGIKEKNGRYGWIERFEDLDAYPLESTCKNYGDSTKTVYVWVIPDEVEGVDNPTYQITVKNTSNNYFYTTPYDNEVAALYNAGKLKDVYLYSWNSALEESLDSFFGSHPEYKRYVHFINYSMGSIDSRYQEKIDDNLREDRATIVAIDREIIPNELTNNSIASVDRIGIQDTNNIETYYKKNAYDYTIKEASSNGSLKMVSDNVNPGCFMYNKTVAKAVLGTNDPDEVQQYINDWDGFFAVAEKTKKAGYYMTSGSDQVLESEEELKEKYQKLVENGYEKGNTAWDDPWREDIEGNQVFGYFAAPWLLWTLDDETLDNYDMCTAPCAYVYGGSYYAANTKCEGNPLVAQILYMLTCDETVMGKTCGQGNGDMVNNQTVVREQIRKQTPIFKMSGSEAASMWKRWDTYAARIGNDAWLANELTYGNYAVQVDDTNSFKISQIGNGFDARFLQPIEQSEANNVKTVTGTGNDTTITVYDTNHVVKYNYTIGSTTYTLQFAPYKADMRSTTVAESQTQLEDGGTVVDSVILEAGKITGKQTETMYDSSASNSQVILTEQKDGTGTVVKEADIAVNQAVLNSDDIKKAVDVTNQKNAEYEKDMFTDASIQEINAVFSEDANQSISKSVFDSLKDKSVTLSLNKETSDETNAYTWTFDGSTISKSVDLKTGIETKELDKTAKELIPEDTANCMLDFAQDGDLPGKAKVTVNVATSNLVADQLLYCYYYDEDNGTLLDEQQVTVDQAGNVAIEIEHCCKYVLTNAKVAIKVDTVAIEEPESKEVQIGNSIQLKATVTPENATNQKVIWKSDNKDIASVDEEGKVTAKAEGTVKIRAVSADNEEKFAEIELKIVACKHSDTEVRDKKKATCVADGYTGDVYCKECKELVEKGTVIPKTGKHTAGEWEGEKAATTTEEGSRIKKCTVCGEVVDREAIAKLPAPEPTPTPAPAPVVTPDVTVSYRTHVQSFGWQGVVTNGTMSGTSGKAKRLEGIEISVAGNSNLGIQYTTHCQSYGWLPWSANGEMNGTEGEAKRLEAIKIQLTGADKDKYNVYYRVHAQSYGWLAWAANGAPAGTAGLAKRLEAIQIVIVKKGESFDHAIGNIQSARGEAYIASSTANANPVVAGENNVNVEYRTHVQSFGWQGWKYNGVMSGTSGKAKRLEGINIKLTNKPYRGSIVYTTHVQSIGWQGNENNVNTWFRDGQMAGTSGRAKRLEAIRIALTGEMAEHYDVYYRVHAQSFGWLDWTKNGEAAGTAGLAKRLEGIQIVLVPKGGAAPARNYGGVVTINNNSYIKR